MSVSLDPLRRDLVLTARKDWQAATTPAEEMMRLRLLTHRGSVPWDLTFGSTLHELARAKVPANLSRDVEDRVRSALKPLLDAGILAQLEVTAARAGATSVSLVVRAVDGGYRVVQFTTFIAVG